MKLLTKNLEGKLLENGDAEMFGYCHLGDDELAQFGTVMLSELESIQLPIGMTIERDLYIPKEIDLIQALKRDGYQVPDYIKDSYHVRIVEKCENEKVYTIEENSNDDMCRQKEYDINSNVICGYGTPMY